MTTLEAISKISEQKKKAHIFPYHATFREIASEMGIDIMEVKDNVIKQGLPYKRTINV